MTDYTELKPLLDACRAENCDGPREFRKAVEALFEVCTVETISALIAENERLTTQVRLAGVSAEVTVHQEVGRAITEVLAVTIERDQLRAEIAGLKTGYEAYERVNAQLKAENEALRKECDARHPFKPFHEPAIGFTGCVICGVYTDHGGLPCPKTRATADAAMGKGEQS
ncbi:hypothetical protein [Pseudomonas antarctica]|uniref:hypothetical protein n=1 Tax=Pseudomonas antarctica TaxID=219572 RepID=UPI003F74B69A